MKRALICGISGQDGCYLADLLLKKGYEVIGGSRDAQVSPFYNLKKLGIFERVQLESVNLTDFRSTLQCILKYKPDEVYNLSGQSSVGLSFSQPVETLESIITGTLNILEAIRFSGLDLRFYNAGSSECFGDTNGHPADEQTAFAPQSPYGIAKSSAYWLVDNYRKSYALNACTGILFNHESPLRPGRFVTRKIISTAIRISRGSAEKLHLGNVDIVRDWGWAPEYVEAMWLMLQNNKMEDFVIASGESNSLRSFVAYTFERLGLEQEDHVSVDPSLLRPSDFKVGSANPAKAHEKLGWKASIKMKGVIDNMIDWELENL